MFLFLEKGYCHYQRFSLTTLYAYSDEEKVKQVTRNIPYLNFLHLALGR